MTDNNDPLQDLLTEDVQSIDRNRLATFLKPYVRFDKTTKELHLLSDFERIISNDAKIEVLLVASKARSLIFNDKVEGLSPIEIIKLDVMPEGSVKTSVKKLADARKIKKNTAGKYRIPSYHIDKIINRLERSKLA